MKDSKEITTNKPKTVTFHDLNHTKGVQLYDINKNFHPTAKNGRRYQDEGLYILEQDLGKEGKRLVYKNGISNDLVCNDLDIEYIKVVLSEKERVFLAPPKDKNITTQDLALYIASALVDLRQGIVNAMHSDSVFNTGFNTLVRVLEAVSVTFLDGELLLDNIQWSAPKMIRTKPKAQAPVKVRKEYQPSYKVQEMIDRGCHENEIQEQIKLEQKTDTIDGLISLNPKAGYSNSNVKVHRINENLPMYDPRMFSQHQASVISGKPQQL